MIRHKLHDGADAFNEELHIVGADVLPKTRTRTPDESALYQEWTTTSAMLPSGALFHCTSAGAFIGHGGTSKEHSGLVMPWVDSKPSFHQGVEMRRHGISLYGPGTQHVGSYNAESAFTICVFDNTRVCAHLASLLGTDKAALAEDTFSILNLPRETRHGFEEAVRTVQGLRTQLGETLPCPSVMASIEDRILNLIAEGIRSTMSTERCSMPRHSTRLQMVSACWELSKQLLDVNLTLKDLCVAANACARVLQYAFREFIGITPNTFLRNHRLTRAHRMLLSGAAVSVKEAAYLCGFTELGRFSSRYRALFGCYPRETRMSRKA